MRWKASSSSCASSPPKQASSTALSRCTTSRGSACTTWRRGLWACCARSSRRCRPITSRSPIRCSFSTARSPASCGQSSARLCRRGRSTSWRCMGRSRTTRACYWSGQNGPSTTLASSGASCQRASTQRTATRWTSGRASPSQRATKRLWRKRSRRARPCFGMCALRRWMWAALFILWAPTANHPPCSRPQNESRRCSEEASRRRRMESWCYRWTTPSPTSSRRSSCTTLRW
mmetsp:Transcript_18223/g.36917  ORF Transcript_18223/g.36917 Transcript_18223/m.36917 type:complete len:232 (+) Transcript_18223:277-972(+)